MADNDLGYRFTNEMYATKKEVQNILKVTLIDKHWTHIVEYRSHFTTKTGVKSIDDTYFSICLAPSITDKINAIERKINKIYKLYNKKFEATFHQPRIFLSVFFYKIDFHISTPFITPFEQ